MSFTDRNLLRIRCDDSAKWESFWDVVQFIIDLAVGQTQWRRLTTGVFAGLVGIQNELASPGAPRVATGFPSEDTPSCIGGIDMQTRQFFAESTDVFIAPFHPFNRKKAHISEIEFLAEVLCAAIWSHNYPALTMCGITDDACSHIWISGKSRTGVGLDISRTFHLGSIRSNFRFFSFYRKSGRNFSPDFLSSATRNQIDDLRPIAWGVLIRAWHGDNFP